MISLICGILKKKKRGTNERIYKTEVESQMQKTSLWLSGDKGGGINQETGIDYTTMYKMDYY